MAEAILNHDVVVVKQWQNETRKKWEDKIFKERTRVVTIFYFCVCVWMGDTVILMI